jgi:acyl-homoserine-lactone acylase
VRIHKLAAYAATTAIAALLATQACAAPHDVRIRRDAWGVPHILGKTDADAAFGLGYAQAEDDFATLQAGTIQARGLKASIEGPSGVDSDYMVQLMDVWGTIQRRYDKDLPAETRAVLDAYAEGVNAYAAKHPEKVIKGLAPSTGRDLVAGMILNSPTFYGLDGVFRRTMAPAVKKMAGASPRVVAELSTEDLPTGSNGLAVGPGRSADGATRLLVNSHQPYTGPFAWYEAVVESGQGWHVAGGFFPGSPFMLHGHNAHLGWANTVNNPDLADVYELKINPANPDQYRLDGAWKTLEKHVAKISVKQPDGSQKVVEREVLASVHGPAVRTDHGVFAIRYAGQDEVRQAQQYFALDKATDLAAWKKAMAIQALPSINYVYADEKGNVGYVYNGKFPLRKEGVDWSGVVPGDRSDLIWTKLVPFAAIPQLWNPKSGLVFNSNNTPFQASAPADDLKPEAYSKTLGVQTNMTNRAYRVLETYGQDPSITEAEFEAYKYDLSYSSRSDAAQAKAAIAALDLKDDPDLAAAQALVAGWDLKVDVTDRATALSLLTAMAMTQDHVAPLEALKRSAGLLKGFYGRIDPQWGEVNRIRRGRLDMPIDGGPDIYRAVYGRPGFDGRLVAAGGDTYVMFVSWDKAGRLSSRSVHQFGSATLDESSPHYADQTPLFVAMKTKPVLFTEDQLKGHIVKDYAP